MELYMMAWGVLFVFGGIWGTMGLRAVLRRKSGPEAGSADDPRFAAAAEDRRILEARLEQMEQEVAFLRELRTPVDRASLPPSGDDRS